MTRYRIAVDTGGTFTDFLAFDIRRRTLLAVKVPSTPSQPERAVREAYLRADIAAQDVQFFALSSTVALNTLLERRGARTGLLTTAGFRDVLEIGRFNRPEMYELTYSKPTPLVPRNRRLEVTERVEADGTVLTSLDEAQCLAAGEDLVALGVESIAICFLNAYRNPAHESRAAEILRERFPEIPVTASHELAREWREFERASTTVLNAYLVPSSQCYLAELDASLEKGKLATPLLVTRSDGGLTPATQAATAPVVTLMSGPAAGVQAAARLGGKAGHRELLTMDIGGTSCDIALVVNGEPVVTHEQVFAGHPVLGSIVDVQSIGAGGGTIAWADSAGALKVGPRSAGAEPGPACYGRGGREATITDAYVVLGLLAPERFLGGAMPLDASLALAALTRLSKRVALTPQACALGIVRILEAQMEGALRVASIERGYDPRDFALFAYGGAGGMHAASLARELGVPKVIVPKLPAHLSPWGILAGDIRQSFSRTHCELLDALSTSNLATSFRELSTLGRKHLGRDGVEQRLRLRGSLELRYVGQSYTLNVACSLPPTTKGLAVAARRFHRAHREAYGYARDGDALELVTIRLDATATTRRPPVTRLAEARRGRAKQSTRQVWLNPTRRTSVPVYDRMLLAPGERVRGPAIIEEPASVTLLNAGQSLEVDAYGMLHVRAG